MMPGNDYLLRQVERVPQRFVPYYPPIPREEYDAFSPWFSEWIPYEWTGDLLADYEDPAAILAVLQNPDKRAIDGRWVWASVIMRLKGCGYINHRTWQNTTCDIPAAAALHEVVGEMLRQQEEIRQTYGAVLDAIATVVGFIPVVGQGIAIVITSASALATGRPISQAALDMVVNAVPGGAAAKEAVLPAIALGKGLLNGDTAEESLIAAARDVVQRKFGENAATAFDLLLALSRGQDLQEIGFAVANRWFKGTSLLDRVGSFTLRATQAAARGESVEKVLIQEAVREVRALPVVEKGEQEVDRAIRLLLAEPRHYLGSIEAFKAKYQIPFESARAAFMAVQMDDYGNLRENGKLRAVFVDPGAQIVDTASNIEKTRKWAQRKIPLAEMSIIERAQPLIQEKYLQTVNREPNFFDPRGKTLASAARVYVPSDPALAARRADLEKWVSYYLDLASKESVG